MTPTFEQTIEMINSLPKSEKQKVFEWAEAKKHEVLGDKKDLTDRDRKFKLALQWIEEHKEEYDGKFVLLEGDKLIDSGTDAKTLYEKARQIGIEIPFVKRIKAKVLPFGGW